MIDHSKYPEKLKLNDFDCSYSRYVFYWNNHEDDSRVKVDSTTYNTSFYN